MKSPKAEKRLRLKLHAPPERIDPYVMQQIRQIVKLIGKESLVRAIRELKEPSP